MKCLLLISALLLTPPGWANLYLYTNLSIELTPDRDRIYPGDSVTFAITVDNPSTVTSNGVVTVRLPEGTTDIISADCIASTTATLLCTLAELSPQSITTLSFTASTPHEGHYKFGAAITSAAFDTDNTDDSDSSIIAVSAQTTTVNTTPVDLAITLSATSETQLISRLASFTVLTSNHHTTNTAVAPVIEIAIPESFAFYTSDTCTASEQVLRCNVESLAPGLSATTTFALNPVSLDADATIQAYATSTQPDQEPSDNETQLLAEIIPAEILCGAGNPGCYGGPAGTDSTIDTPDAVAALVPEPESQPAIAGGGSAPASLSLVFLVLFIYRRRLTGRPH